MGGQRARKKLMWVARHQGEQERAARDAAHAQLQQDTRHAKHSQPTMLDALQNKLQSLGVSTAIAAPAAADVTVHLWPENVRAWRLWQDLQTQWRVVDGEPIGLDYAGARAHMLAVRGASRRGMWECLLACESGYLQGWRTPART